MAYAVRIEKILSEAEDSLRRVVSEAAAGGSYDDVVSIAQIAREIEKLRRLISGVSSHAAPDDGTSSRPITHARKKYPRFFRDGDFLVKVGWSKRHKAEYEHRAPQSVLRALVHALDDRLVVSPNGKFSTEQIFPLQDPKTKAPTPDYQSYVCLAWLCNIGAVEKAGRQGYRLKIQKRSLEHIEKRWAELEEE